jgi:hypothetical protein
MEKKDIEPNFLDKRRNSNIIYIRFFRGADRDTNHYIVVAKITRQRLSVSKQAAPKFNGERFNLKKPNDVEVKEEL